MGVAAVGAAEEIADLVMRDADRPGDEPLRRIVFVPLPPQNQGGLLKQVVRVGPVGQERGDIAIDLRLGRDKTFHELVGIERSHIFQHN